MSTVAVASSSRLAVDAGLAAGADGGNAVDAAVSSMLVSLVTELGICSLGGGAYVTVWPVGRSAEVIDGGCAAPRHGRHRASFLSLVDVDPATLLSSPSTVHTSAVDADGWACAITASGGYASGIIAADTRGWMDDWLGELELLPAGVDGVEPGERLPSRSAGSTATSPRTVRS